MNIRKSIQSALHVLGIDIHRARPSVEPLAPLRQLGIRTVIDVGANIGQFAQEIRDLLPTAMIYSFEPIPECFNQLEVAFAHDRQFKAFNVAIGERATEAAMTISRYSPSSSLLPMDPLHERLFPHTKKERTIRVPVRTLDAMMSNLPIESPLCIKLDVQGYEDQAIAGGLTIFHRAKAVVVETSFATLYQGQPLFSDIFSKLAELGFSYCGSLSQKIARGTIVTQDSLFIRD